MNISLTSSVALRCAEGSYAAPVLHRCLTRDYSTHVTLRNQLPRSALCASLPEEPVRSLARSAFFSAFSLLPGVNLRRERDIPPSSPLSGSFQFAFAFFSPLPLACALPVKRFLFTGELSSNSSETSGCRSSRLSARLLRLSCHCRLLWKAVESQSSCFSRGEDWTEEAGRRWTLLSVSARDTRFSLRR